MRPPLCVYCGATEGRAFRLRGGRPLGEWPPTGHPRGAEWVCAACDRRRRALLLAAVVGASFNYYYWAARE